ncbi:unnamed protein product [Choristocarpus tenellus]
MSLTPFFYRPRPYNSVLLCVALLYIYIGDTLSPLNQAVMSASKTTILVTGNNVDMTEPLKEYVNKKLENKLEKVSKNLDVS